MFSLYHYGVLSIDGWEKNLLNPFWDFRVAQRSKVLHLSARGITTDPGLIPGCITTGRGRETHSVVHNWPSIVRVRGWFGRGIPSL